MRKNLLQQKVIRKLLREKNALKRKNAGKTRTVTKTVTKTVTNTRVEEKIVKIRPPPPPPRPTFPITEAFNGTKEIDHVIRDLKIKHNINMVIDVGTYTGSTALFFGQLSNISDVHTIEENADIYNFNQREKRFHNIPTIKAYFGTSNEIITLVLSTLENCSTAIHLLFYFAQPVKPADIEAMSASHISRNKCIMVMPNDEHHNNNLQYDQIYGDNVFYFTVCDDKILVCMPGNFGNAYGEQKRKHGAQNNNPFQACVDAIKERNKLINK